MVERCAKWMVQEAPPFGKGNLGVMALQRNFRRRLPSEINNLRYNRGLSSTQSAFYQPIVHAAVFSSAARQLSGS